MQLRFLQWPCKGETFHWEAYGSIYRLLTFIFKVQKRDTWHSPIACLRALSVPCYTTSLSRPPASGATDGRGLPCAPPTDSSSHASRRLSMTTTTNSAWHLYAQTLPICGSLMCKPIWASVSSESLREKLYWEMNESSRQIVDSTQYWVQLGSQLCWLKLKLAVFKG